VALFVLVPVLVAGLKDDGGGIDFFGTGGGERECVEDKMAVAGPAIHASEEFVTEARDAIIDLVSELVLRPPMLIQARVCRCWHSRRVLTSTTFHTLLGSLQSSDCGEPSMRPAEPTRDGKLLPRCIFVGCNGSRTDGQSRLCMGHRRRRGWPNLFSLDDFFPP